MRKDWNNPELKNLALESTENDAVTLATNPEGTDAREYSLTEAQNTKIVVPVFCNWYYFNICTGKWEKLTATDLCGAIAEALDKLSKGCGVSA